MAAMADMEDLPAALAAAEAQQPLRAALLSWYDANHRVLPWRRNSHSKRADAAEQRDASSAHATWPDAPGVGAPLSGLSRADFAYGVWVSEVMLQQTQVERVCDYFRRWMARWPTLRALAAAADDDVNTAWAGLGYYRRARFLVQGARYAVEHTGGELPTSVRELLKVPGIGAYTAAAISSIAFGQPAAAVDGNVVRVMARLHALAQDNPSSSKSVKEMQALADALLDTERPGCWNQAVMELGATVCTPRAPRCNACPVAAWCAALRRVRDHAACGAEADGPAVTDFPVKQAKAARRVEAVHVRVVEWVDALQSPAPRWLLMLRRPEGGLLAGQYEFPSAVSAADASPQSRKAALDAMLTALGLQEANGAPAQPAAQLVHVFSHIEHHMLVERVTLQQQGPPRDLAGGSGQPVWRWVAQPADGSAPEGMTGGVRKAWAAAMQPPVAEQGRKKKQRLDA